MSEALLRLAAACLQGTVALAVVWILCRWLRRLPAAWRCWLWRLALLKFLLALFVSVPVAVPSGPTALTMPMSPPQVPKIHSASPLWGNSSASEGLTNGDAREPNFGLPEAVVAVWLLGASALAGGAALGLAKCRRRLRQLRSAEVTLPLGELTAAETKLDVRFDERADAPTLFAVGRPVLVVPPEALELPPAAVRAMMAHELAHLRRGDGWWGLLTWGVACVFWFHPLVWLARREERLQAEIASDALAVRWLNRSQREYAIGLLELLSALRDRRSPTLFPGALRATDDINRRFKAMSVRTYRGPAQGFALSAIAVPALLGLVPLEPQRRPAASTRLVAIPSHPGTLDLLVASPGSDESYREMLTRDNLNTGGTMMPPQNRAAIRQLDEQGIGTNSIVVREPVGTLEFLGLNHVEPGRVRSWSPDGTKYERPLPIVPVTEVPKNGSFERQAVIRIRDGEFRGINGVFLPHGSGVGFPGTASLSNTIPVPWRSNGKRMIVVQQMLPAGTTEADLWIRYYSPIVPIGKVSVSDGKPKPIKGLPEVTLLEGRSDKIRPRGPAKYDPVQAGDTFLLVSKRQSSPATHLRVFVLDRKGREHPCASAIWSYRLAPGFEEGASLFKIRGIAPRDIAEVRFGQTTYETIVFGGVKLHPLK